MKGNLRHLAKSYQLFYTDAIMLQFYMQVIKPDLIKTPKKTTA